MLVSYGGLAAGQFLLKVADPAKYELFLLASILLSFALVPVLISKSQAPEEIDNENMGIRKLVRIAPAGVASIFVSSIAQGSMFGMGAVYGVNAGMDISEIALLMSVFIGVGALAHWPLGWLSDQIDRRLVVVSCKQYRGTVMLLFIADRQKPRLVFLTLWFTRRNDITDLFHRCSAY